MRATFHRRQARLISAVRGTMAIQEFKYDAAGRLKETWYGPGPSSPVNKTIRSYDDANRLMLQARILNALADDGEFLEEIQSCSATYSVTA